MVQQDSRLASPLARSLHDLRLVAEPVSDSFTIADRLMSSFAARTGLSSEASERRYLWTDAFAVCNFWGLARAGRAARARALALRLIDRVHRVLGRHRPDDVRRGWISGLGDDQGELHPTVGGLRIGKTLPERGALEPWDPELEWERDGQYFHYLTKWMHALDQTARWTREPRYNLWARELARTAYDAFSRGGRLAWKMSIDLSRPLVDATGQHDALDGFVTCLQLRATAAELGRGSEEPVLEREAAALESMIEPDALPTADPLGIGGLLFDAGRVLQLRAAGASIDVALPALLIAASIDGLRGYLRRAELERPAAARLAFRELGLGIGLRAVEHAGTPALVPYLSLADEIESFWRDERHRSTPLWAAHRDINEVMLATSLVPRGVTELPSLRGSSH